MLIMALARSLSDGNAIRYLFPVFWMTSCFHMIQAISQNHRRRVCFVQFARWQHRGQSLQSPTACCYCCCCCCCSAGYDMFWYSGGFAIKRVDQLRCS